MITNKIVGKRGGSENTFLIVLSIVLIFAIVGILFFANKGISVPNTATVIAEQPTASAERATASPFATRATGSTEEGDVLLELTPQKEDNNLVVEIKANTHSVDLSPFNLKDIVTLTYDGKVYKPTSAPKLSGHHATGKLVFETPATTESFTISIAGIPLEKERIFTW